MPYQRHIVGNIAITVNGMLHSACCNTKVYSVLRRVIIHQGINDAAYKCIAATDTVKVSRLLSYVFPFSHR